LAVVGSRVERGRHLSRPRTGRNPPAATVTTAAARPGRPHLGWWRQWRQRRGCRWRGRHSSATETVQARHGLIGGGW